MATTSLLEALPEVVGGGVLEPPAGEGAADADAAAADEERREHMGAAHAELNSIRRERGNTYNMLKGLETRRNEERKRDKVVRERSAPTTIYTVPWECVALSCKNSGNLLAVVITRNESIFGPQQFCQGSQCWSMDSKASCLSCAQ